MKDKIIGIYKIQSKTYPERIYIGGSDDVYNRFCCHRYRLRKGTHWSNKMQTHFNEYGMLDFEFVLLCDCEKFQLIQFEQYFIDFYHPYFNTHTIADKATGVKRSAELKLKFSLMRKGVKRGPLSEEHKKKIGEAHKGMKFSEESLKKMRKSHLGQKSNLGHRHSEETKLKISRTKKGSTPWNKGLVNIYSDETKKLMGKGRRGKAGYNTGKTFPYKPRAAQSVAMKKYWMKRKTNEIISVT